MAIVLFFFVFLVQVTTALECLKCTDVEFDLSSLSSDEKAAAENLVQALFSNFRNPECAYATSTQKDVTLDTCNASLKVGEENSCGDLDGTVLYFELNINIHIRGCFVVDKMLKGGCYTDKAIIDRQNNILTNMSILTSFQSSADIKGQLCINTDEVPAAWQYFNTAGNIVVSTCVIFLCLTLILFVKTI